MITDKAATLRQIEDVDKAVADIRSRLSGSGPFSLCEARLDEPTYHKLTCWMKDRLTWPVITISRWKAGALLLHFIAETARREAQEGHVWSSVCDKFAPEVRRRLFAGGQPTSTLKELIKDAAKRLKLRHVFDRTDTQSWYLTTYLQFGFTEKGMHCHLPTWLVGQGISAAAQYLLSGALCDTLRLEGIVTLGNDELDWGYQSGGVPLGRWASRNDVGSGLLRFVGATTEQRRRKFATGVLRSVYSDLPNAEELSPQVLEAAFDALLARATKQGETVRDDELPWLQRQDRQTTDGAPKAAIRLVFPQLGLRRPPTLFRCEKTGHVWPRSVAGCAPEIGCEGTIEPTNDELLDTDPRLGRLRKEYRESRVFQLGLWAEEHSAQLSPRENRRLQDLFKAGIRNILSATTTLELGIDIGGLTAALLSNVPPGKANYLQRAGRAGRRADGSAAVITFARPRPFDREVFRRFGDYLSQPLRKPLVFLDRERVVRRHLHAYLLGEFFRGLYGPEDRRGAMDAFGNMGQFCGKAQGVQSRSCALFPGFWGCI
ncbi:MAG TPA: helicase-related protein [Pirellulales bacterium]|nr:helicase-related protein [Pirellulales bacterium]